MGVYLNGAAWVVGAACVGAVIAFVARYFGLDEGRPENNEATGQVFVIVAGLHAVVVAFVLITLSDNVNSVREDAYSEAESLVAVSWAVDSVSDNTDPEVRDLGVRYATTVVQEEWPKMRQGLEVSGRGWEQLDQLRAAVDRVPADGDWEESRKTEASDRLEEVYEGRQDRVTGSSGEGGVVAVVWFVLVVGTFSTVLLPNLFGGTTVASHVIVVSTLAGSLALVLFAIYQMQNPFSGGSKIGPDAFHWALDRLG